MCIVSVGRNVNNNSQYAKYLQSVFRLDYDNYKVVIVYDCSTDSTVAAIKQHL